MGTSRILKVLSWRLAFKCMGLLYVTSGAMPFVSYVVQSDVVVTSSKDFFLLLSNLFCVVHLHGFHGPNGVCSLTLAVDLRSFLCLG